MTDGQFLTTEHLDRFKTRADDRYAESEDLAQITSKVEEIMSVGGESNVIESISVNGVPLEPDNRSVDVQVPAKVEDLSDAGDYAKKTDIPTTVSGLIDSDDYAKKTDIPTTVSGLTDSDNYAKKTDIPTTVSGLTDSDNYAKKTDIPTTVSGLIDSDDYAKKTDVPGKVSDLSDSDDYAKASDIPAKVSKLENDSGYQTSEQVSDLIATALTSAVIYRGSVDSQSNLPTEGLENGDMWNIIATDMNYVWNGTSWDPMATMVDISGKADKEEIPTKVSDLSDSDDYAKKTDIPTTVASLTDASNYAKKTDIPAKVSDLSEADEYAKKTDVPTTVASLADAGDYAKKTDIPTTVASLTDSAEYAKKTDLSGAGSLELGETEATAFRGDRGKAAYDHAVTNKGSAFASKLYKIQTNSEGHVTGAVAVQKSDITALGIPASDTHHTARLEVGTDYGTSSDSVSDPYLKLVENGSRRNAVQFRGAGIITVQSSYIDEHRAIYIGTNISEATTNYSGLMSALDKRELATLSGLGDAIKLSEKTVSKTLAHYHDPDWSDYNTSYTMELSVYANTSYQNIYVDSSQTTKVDTFRKAHRIMYNANYINEWDGGNAQYDPFLDDVIIPYSKTFLNNFGIPDFWTAYHMPDLCYFPVTKGLKYLPELRSADGDSELPANGWTEDPVTYTSFAAGDGKIFLDIVNQIALSSGSVLKILLSYRRNHNHEATMWMAFGDSSDMWDNADGREKDIYIFMNDLVKIPADYSGSPLLTEASFADKLSGITTFDEFLSAFGASGE